MALLNIKFITDISNTSYAIAEFHGEIDQSTMADAEDKIFKIVENFGGKCLFFDLTDLKFINSEGVGFIVAVHAKLAKKEKTLALFGPQTHVAEIFEAVGFGKMIPIFKTIKEAKQKYGFH